MDSSSLRAMAPVSLASSSPLSAPGPQPKYSQDWRGFKMSSLPVDGLLFVARHGAGEPGLELAPFGLQVLAALPRLVHLLLQLPHLHKTKPSAQNMNAGHCCPGAESSAAEQSWSWNVTWITGKGTIIYFSFIECALGTHSFFKNDLILVLVLKDKKILIKADIVQKKNNFFTFL